MTPDEVTGSRDDPPVVTLSIRLRRKGSGHNGFEELRKYIKQGGDFCKDLVVILQERADLEATYAKGLSKLSSKLLKASRDNLGSISQAWQMAGAEMEYEGDLHKSLAVAFSEDVIKPLKSLVESQHKVRKSVEAMVDKTARNLTEWRNAEAKSKKQCYMVTRENEKVQEQLLDARLGRLKGLTDKEMNKCVAKKKKAEENVKRADQEYYSFCLRSERARLEWESSVSKGSHCFQTLEEERLAQLRELALRYYKQIQQVGPKLTESSNRLTEPMNTCSIEKDVETVINIKGTGQNVPEQLLPDFYAEDTTNAMNRERRKQSLENFLHMVRIDIDRERKGKQGVENLAKAFQETPTFGTEGSQQDVTEKLQHMKALLTYLEATRAKLLNSLAELDGRAKFSHPLSKHIECQKDKQGLMQSVLKVPFWIRREQIDIPPTTNSPDWTDRGTADGNSIQPDSDFDEFSSQGSERDYQQSILINSDSQTYQNGTLQSVSSVNSENRVRRSNPAVYPDFKRFTADIDRVNGDGKTPSNSSMENNKLSVDSSAVPSIGRCKVLYEYQANMYDELTIKPGDIINIHDKQEDGWWLGELNGVVGIFPATYVEETR